MICIPLSKGRHAIIDNESFDIVCKYRWHANEFRKGQFRAVAATSRKNGRKSIYMHRLLMGITDSSIQVDHIDGDMLNNVLSNLRVATNQQNKYNTKKPSNNSSGFKGVSFSKCANKWHAYISAENKRFHLGLFLTPEEAHAAYCSAAKKLHGEFARFE